MKVIIPVAGIGTRLKPHTFSLPKPLLRVAGKHILTYVLEPLAGLDIDEVIFVIGFKGGQIKQFVEENFSFKARFVWQDRLLGLGYAVRLAMEQMEAGPVLIVLGDTIVECKLEEFVAAGDYVLGVHQVEDPNRFGIAEIEDGIVSGLEEKPKSPKTNLALVGLYYFKESDILKGELETLVRSGKYTSGEIQLTDALSAMIDTGTKFVPYEVDRWYDCGKKDTVLKTNRHFLRRMPPPVAISGSVLVPPVHVSPSARIVSSVVGPYVSIADDAEIDRCIIRNSIVGGRVTLENAVIEDSLIGQKAVIRGGRRILNVGDSSEVDCT